MGEQSNNFAHLYPLIGEHLQLLVDEFHFTDSSKPLRATNSRWCTRQFDLQDPPISVVVGAWFPEFEITMNVELLNDNSELYNNSYDINEINRALNGSECPKFFTHSCYSYDKQIVNDVLLGFSELLRKFVNEYTSHPEALRLILSQNQARECERYAREQHDQRTHRDAESAWDRKEFSQFLKYIARLVGPLSATDRKRIYIANKELHQHKG